MKNDDYYCTAINNNKEDVSLTTKIKELELELAQTKLALVEAECRNQVDDTLCVYLVCFSNIILSYIKLTSFLLLFDKNV